MHFALHFECIVQFGHFVCSVLHCVDCGDPALCVLQCVEPLLVGQYPAFRHISSVCLSV